MRARLPWGTPEFGGSPWDLFGRHSLQQHEGPTLVSPLDMQTPLKEVKTMGALAPIIHPCSVQSLALCSRRKGLTQKQRTQSSQ